MREAATAFFGLGAHLGSARSQNGKGHVLGHVQDLGLDVHDPNVRIYQTNERQTFHTDSCDIVGLLCLKTAQVRRPVGAGELDHDLQRDAPPPARPAEAPVRAGRHRPARRGARGPEALFPRFRRSTGTRASSPRSTSASTSTPPSASPTRRGSRRRTSRRSTCSIRWPTIPRCNMFMEFKPGDVQLVHNHTMLHDRTGFVDWPEPRAPPPSAAAVAGGVGRAAAARGLRPALRHGHGRRPRRHHRARHQAACAAGGGLTRLRAAGWLTAGAVVPK